MGDFKTKLKKITEQFTPEFINELKEKHYKEDREYPENFSNWYPHIKSFGNFAHADIISNQIFTFEETEIMKETDDINKVNWNKINEILKPTLDKMEPYKIYNIKNGCFSNKFDFKTCLATKENLAQQLWKINYQSSMFDTGGYTELVVREYIPYNNENTLTIYNGMPLRTEIRAFHNLDTRKIEYIVDYWNYDYCSKGMHSLNDKVIFDIYHNKTNIEVVDHQKEFEKVSKFIEENIDTLKFDNKLKGIWSIDFMYDNNSNSIYLIDMARGFRSAYWNTEKLKKIIGDDTNKSAKNNK